MNKATNILVVQPLPGIGDLFWFDAALQSLSAFYKTPVTLLTKRQSQAQALYDRSLYIKEVLWLDRPGRHDGLLGMMRLVRMLRQKKFSAVWILHKSWRYRWACKLAGIPEIKGYPSEAKWLEKHPTQRTEMLLEKYGVPVLKDLRFPILPEAKNSIKKQLQPYKKPWLALGIGGSEPSKKWAAAHWEDLAVWLSVEKQVSVFLLGGKKEAEEAASMVSFIQEKGGEAVALTHFSLQESLAFLDQVDLFIGNDTGMMNGAAVLNKPVIGLFLSTPPLVYRQGLQALQPLLGATDISLAQVQQAVDQTLASPK